MKIDEILQEAYDQANEGAAMDMVTSLIPKKVKDWALKNMRKKQYDALVMVYGEIMSDPISRPDKPSEGLYRAAKTVGLNKREIQRMFHDFDNGAFGG